MSVDTTEHLDEALLPYFPADTVPGSLDYNKIAAVNSMIDFFAKKDPSCVERYFATPYVNHNTRAPDGLDPVHGLANAATGWQGVHTIIRRVLAQDDLVLLHSVYSNLMGVVGQRVAFDLFRFKDGKIVEHWDALEDAVPPDQSGLTQTAGSVDIVDHHLGDANRQIVKRFIEEVLVRGRTELVPELIDTAALVEHSPRRAPGLEREHGSFRPAPGSAQATYVAGHRFLVEGNFVLVQGEGRIADSQVLEVYDLFRLQSGRIVEHWDVLQPLAPQDQWANPNGAF